MRSITRFQMISFVPRMDVDVLTQASPSGFDRMEGLPI
jgi:hypothetical protein